MVVFLSNRVYFCYGNVVRKMIKKGTSFRKAMFFLVIRRNVLFKNNVSIWLIWKWLLKNKLYGEGEAYFKLGVINNL